jgi:hypothetical protein
MSSSYHDMSRWMPIYGGFGRSVRSCAFFYRELAVISARTCSASGVPRSVNRSRACCQGWDARWFTGQNIQATAGLLL